MNKTYEFDRVDMNALHDQLLAALNLEDVNMLHVDGSTTWVRLTYPNPLEAPIEAVIAAYVYVDPVPHPRIVELSAAKKAIRDIVNGSWDNLPAPQKATLITRLVRAWVMTQT